MMSGNVAIVIVSHSELVARGAAEMAAQMVGDDVVLQPCAGNKDGGLGTDVGRIKAALDKVFTPAGVLVIVDLGGAETNAEAAIELMDAEKQSKIALCDAAIVEGTILAATEAASGAPLARVLQVAEEYR